MPALTLDALRRDMEAYGLALADEEYENAVGLDDTVDTAAVHARFAHLHASTTLAFVQRALERARDPMLRRRLKHLEMDVFSSVMAERFAAEEDALVTAESKATVTVGDVTVKWRDVGDRIRNEDDRETRRRWKHGDDAVTRRFLPRAEDLERRSRDAARAMGYPDDATAWERVHGVSLRELAARVGRVIRDTDAVYARALADRLRRAEGLSLAEVEGHDVAHMMRAKEFDEAFPKAGLVPAFHGFLAGLGFDLARMPNVRVDLEERPGKDSRAFVLPARVPQDVRLVTKPTGGVDDYRELFHESGHALHFALTRESLPYEHRYFGDDGVTESYAFLFEHLFENPRFLADVAPDLKGDALRDYLAYCGLDKLMSFRYYAAALAYDVWAATAPLEAMPERYVATLTPALKYPVNPLHYLDTDGFDGVWYLEAWMLEAAHRAFLERAFGARWWTHPDAGAHLARLYAEGTRFTVADVAREIGLPDGRLNVDAVLADVRRLLAA